MGRGDPFVFWVGVFLVVALVARKVLVAMEQTALQKSFEAWMPPQWEVLEDWIPVPAPRSPRRLENRLGTLAGDGRRRRA